MYKDICAPGTYDPDNNTCFSIDQLIALAIAYNRYITKNVSGDRHPYLMLIKIIPDKKYLLNKLLQVTKEVCDSDHICITRQQFMNLLTKEMLNNIHKNTFRPQGPSEAIEWLSNEDIDNIMNQYEKKYLDFQFLGALPSNCQELSFCKLYNIDFDDYFRKGKCRLAIVHNLDEYGKGGSHWVATFINISNYCIYFCDSMGYPPKKNIKKIVDTFNEYCLNKTGEKAIYKFNEKKYQTDNSECGVYSCNFIIRMLSGESFESIIQNSLSFEKINSCRNRYFRNKPSKHHIDHLCDPQSER